MVVGGCEAVVSWVQWWVIWGGRGLLLEWVGGYRAVVVGWVRRWLMGCVLLFFYFGVSVEMFWCFGLDVPVIAGFWSQFEDGFVCFACLVAKKMHKEKQKY